MLFAIVQDPSSKLIRGRDDELELIARALKKQLNEQLCPAWDRAPCEVVYQPDPHLLDIDMPHAFPLVILDEPDAPGVLGYHVERGAKIFLRPSLDLGSDLISGEYAVSGVVAHEAFEVLGDRTVNLWAQMNPTTITAIELADAVEHDPVPVPLDDGTIVMGSNFLLPAWFDPQDLIGPYDWATAIEPSRAHAVRLPFSLSPRGYMIVESTIPGTERQAAEAVGAGEVISAVAHGPARPYGAIRRSYLFGRDYPAHKRVAKIQHGRRARKLAGL